MRRASASGTERTCQWQSLTTAFDPKLKLAGSARLTTPAANRPSCTVLEGTLADGELVLGANRVMGFPPHHNSSPEKEREGAPTSCPRMGLLLSSPKM